MRMQSHFPPAWSRATQIARYRSSAAVSANSKTKPLRAGAHGRTTGCLARWPLAPRSVCPNTSPWFPTPLKYAAPPVSTGRAVHQTLTFVLRRNMSQQQHARDQCLRKEARSSPRLFSPVSAHTDLENKRNSPAQNPKIRLNCESRVSDTATELWQNCVKTRSVDTAWVSL